MTQYTNPIPVGDDPSNYGDTHKLEFMRQLVLDRRDAGIAIPRFVRALNKAGYSITLKEYKSIEQVPGKGIAHIDEWLLEYAYRVINATRVQNSVQGKHTARAMIAISKARRNADLDYLDMAKRLTGAGVPITEAEYRTAEQGMTKHVPFEVIAATCFILGISSEDIL